MDPKTFSECFLDWVKQVTLYDDELIAFDGLFLKYANTEIGTVNVFVGVFLTPKSRSKIDTFFNALYNLE